tara:strand:+ start:743 stop:859 length:117 start_codon:yes stop_codon:yes gene_type:complete
MTDIIVETEASIEEVTKALDDAGIKAFVYTEVQDDDEC